MELDFGLTRGGLRTPGQNPAFEVGCAEKVGRVVLLGSIFPAAALTSRMFLKRRYTTRPLAPNLSASARAARIQEDVDEIPRDVRFKQ